MNSYVSVRTHFLPAHWRFETFMLFPATDSVCSALSWLLHCSRWDENLPSDSSASRYLVSCLLEFNDLGGLDSLRTYVFCAPSESSKFTRSSLEADEPRNPKIERWKKLLGIHSNVSDSSSDDATERDPVTYNRNQRAILNFAGRATRADNLAWSSVLYICIQIHIERGRTHQVVDGLCHAIT